MKKHQRRNKSSPTISFLPPIFRHPSFFQNSLTPLAFLLILIIIFWRHEDAKRGVIAHNLQIQAIRPAGQPQVPGARSQLAPRKTHQLHRYTTQEDQPTGTRQPQSLAKLTACHWDPLAQEQEPKQLWGSDWGEQEKVDLLHLTLRNRHQQL